ncbi:MAG: bifunctional diaminohydroxyphosphoribosylaminopyrimidine deaminase/5-amino-6-(5-phosphoribosylamino)uracil reductase RibD [Gammaproteobacteria bacterium]|nr:bifunctional diaminohydroxyphosphoribosylaminopyrimidine deaminase/5-amino-6-(5-phosphoribosylamino)uracil reductase RibD [Gammaproteobacteria bacterium]
MAHALQLAARGLYTAHPNPRVGCVIVEGGAIVGEGWHQRTGEAHAEIHALNQAGAKARGATVYVTLEPCCHHGRTPPCTEALIQAGVARVVAALPDPNPKVAGHGLKQLSAAGIAPESGLMQTEAEKLNRGFVMRMRTGRPLVRVKLAMTLDGRTAAASGESKWISGEAARTDVQHLRAESGAIMTGVNTVLSDDPLLTVRLPEFDAAQGQQPLRVVLDSRLRLPHNARMLVQPGRTLVITGAQDAGRNHPAAVETVSLAGQEGKVDLRAALQHLATQHEINDVLVEAGPILSGALVEAKLADELVLYLAPALLGDSARGLLHLPALQHLAQRVALDILDLRAIGQDWRITAKPLYT